MKRTSYSHHDVDPGAGPKGKGWVVVQEELDEHGDVVDTELVRFFRTEEPARRLAERLNAEAQQG